jgi:hypothetical protein
MTGPQTTAARDLCIENIPPQGMGTQIAHRWRFMRTGLGPALLDMRVLLILHYRKIVSGVLPIVGAESRPPTAVHTTIPY